MADQTKNTIVSELDDRLDTLFGEDVGDLDALEESPLEGLKSLVMTIDWEISESTLNALLEELNSLRTRYAGDKPVSILLKMMTSLSSYVQKRKGSSHPESIQLFHAVAKDLAKIVEDPGMDPRTRNAVVKKDIDRFQGLKSEIVGAKKEEEVSPPPEAQPVVEEEIPKFEPVPEVQESVSVFEPEPSFASEPEEYPSAPPASVEHQPPLEGTIEFKEDVEPVFETPEKETEKAESVVDLAPSVEEQALDTIEGERIPEYEMPDTPVSDLEQILEETSEMEGMPTVGVAQEISESTSEDLDELDEIFKEELSRVEKPLEEPAFEPIPSPEELGIAADVSLETQIEDAEPLIITGREELADVFEVSEEPMDEMESLFAEQPDFSVTEPVTETMETVTPESVKPEAPFLGEAQPEEPASLQPILEAIRALGRELHDELDGLRSEVNETKDRLNQLLEYKTELSSSERFEAASRESFDMDFETREDDEDRLFSGEGFGENAPKEAEERLGFEETSLEDIFEDSVTAGEHEEQEEETKTLQELFEEAVAPRTAEDAEIMDFEFEGEDSGPETAEPVDDLLAEVEMEEIEPASQLGSESDLVAVTLTGREYVLPAEYVVKTGKIKDKTRAKILKSGAATMDDLRGPFQSLKKDVFPAWEHLSQKELRQLSFPVVSTDAEDSEDQAKGRGIVLLRIGDRCGTLIADDVPIRVGAEDAESVESLDVEQLLSTRSS